MRDRGFLFIHLIYFCESIMNFTHNITNKFIGFMLPLLLLLFLLLSIFLLWCVSMRIGFIFRGNIIAEY